MRGLLALLELVRLARERQFARAEPHLVGAVAHRVLRHVAGVPQSVHVTDLVPVVSRDRHFDDALLRLYELDDDFGVEVETIGVSLKRYTAQGRHAIGPISRMPFGK